MIIKEAASAIAWIVISFLPGTIGQLFTYPNIATWYAGLNKPFFTPPNWLFGPAWTTLYVLMGVSAYLVWKKGWQNSEVKVALSVFIVQLFLNGLWSLIFFGWHLTLVAFIEILILWGFILLTIMKFYPLSSAAGLLLVPYLLWVTFASALNFGVWWLNR